MERLHASVSVMVARTHKRPESASSKISFGRGAPEHGLQSFPDATRAGCNGRAPSDASSRDEARLAGQPWAPERAQGDGEGPKPDDSGPICGPGAAAPAALRGTPHAAHAGEALCWAGARVQPESLGVICARAYAAGRWRSGRHLTVLILTHYLSILSGAYSSEPSDCHRGSTREKLHHWHETRMPPVRF